MTREEAIEILQGAIKKPNTKDGYLGQAIDMAIKALEPEPVLDKIRAEIETKYGQCSICEYDSDYGGRWYYVGDIADILQMIDNCKAESEE